MSGPSDFQKLLLRAEQENPEATEVLNAELGGIATFVTHRPNGSLRGPADRAAKEALVAGRLKSLLEATKLVAEAFSVDGEGDLQPEAMGLVDEAPQAEEERGMDVPTWINLPEAD